MTATTTKSDKGTRSTVRSTSAASTRPLSRWRSPRQIERSSGRAGLWALAIAMVVFFELHVGGFVTQGNLVQIGQNLAPTLIAAVPAARLLITGNVDLSIAGGYAMLGVLNGWLLQELGASTPAIVLTLLAGAAVGAANGMLVRTLAISPIIVTLALGTVYTAIALITTNGNALYDFPASFSDLALYRLAGIPLTVIVAFVVFAVGAAHLSRTVSGLRSYAIGGSIDAARLSGIRADRHVLTLYVYMGVSVALLATTVNAAIGSASPTNGIGFEIDVLTAIILGGVAFQGGAGRWTGILIGVVVLGVLQAGFVFEGLNSYYQLFAKGALLLIALGVDQLVAARRRSSRAAAVDDAPPAAEPAVIATEDEATTRAGELACVGLTKTFGAVTANRDISFTARSGAVTCLLGDNGAGKSTLIKMLSGVLQPNEGSMALDGSLMELRDPADAHKAGIHTVYQELALCPNLGAALNLVLGDEPRRGPRWLDWLDRAEAERVSRERLSGLGVALSDYFRPINQLSGGQRQCVAIARVNVGDANVVILDEPTAALGVKQTAQVLSLARRLADHGAAVIMITHDVDSVMAVADHVVVLNLGRVIYDGEISTVDAGQLIHLMAGYGVEEPHDTRAISP